MIAEDNPNSNDDNFAYIDRNITFIKPHLLESMDAGLSVGNRLIDEEMIGLSMVARPIVKAFYSSLVRKDLERGTIKSINGIIKMGKLMILDGVETGSEEFYRRLKEKYPAYLKNDQTGRQCKKTHRNFPKISKTLEKSFEWQIRGILPLLGVKEEVHSYNELCRKAFPTAEECKITMIGQIDAMDAGLKIIESDLSVLDIPTARPLIMKVLRKGFNQKTKDFLNEVDEIYENK